MRYMQIIGLVVYALMAVPTYAIAQSDQPIWLFNCTLNDGANSVGVHVYNDEITYSYANSVGQIELNLNDTVADVKHVLALWDDPNFTESITFYNSATSYEVFSEAARSQPIGARAILDGGPVDGGIVVTAPDGTRNEILCDENTITPRAPLMRLARLALLQDEDYDLTVPCMARSYFADGCFRLSLDQCEAIARDAADPADCLPLHLARATARLDATYLDALAMTEQRGADVVALDNAQDIWNASRAADCKIGSWSVYNVFDENMGLMECNFDYTVRRIKFLRRYIAGVEFDG